MWLTDPKPCNETVTVSLRPIPDAMHDDINGWRMNTVSQVDQFLDVGCDDTAHGVTPVGPRCRYGTEEWVMHVLSAYDQVLLLRERDPEKKGMIFSF